MLDYFPFWMAKRIAPDHAGCWIWTGSRTTSGYGNVRDRRLGRTRGAHRVAYEIGTGQTLPPGEPLDHLCGVILCVNPAHLELVTHTENLRRAWVAHGTRPTAAQQAATNPPPIREKPVSTDPPRPRRQVNVRLPDDLVDRIDARRARLDLSRDAWMEAAAEYALQAAEGPDPGAFSNSVARTATPPHRRR